MIPLKEKKQYLVIEDVKSKYPPGELLSKFLSNLERNSDVDIIKISGNLANPNLVVIKTIPHIMESLSAEFRDQLLFEEDRSLTLFLD